MTPSRAVWPIIYVASVVFVNWGFATFPGQEWLWSLIVGSIFITRDFCQRAVGHWCLLAMALAGAISWWMADPFVAIASVAAFAVSETADWLVYTTTKRPLADRVLLSSAISSPLDSAVFLSLIGALSVELVTLQVAAKLTAALIVYILLRRLSWSAAA